jgi:predicted O-linked N-acetylglucosamine transferase (SPINDLY family)
MNLQQQFEAGLLHHQSGRLAEADSIYRSVLAQEPNHADALHLSGVLAAQAGRLDEAIESIRRAIFICPTNAVYFANLGNALKAKGHLEEAIAAYRQAIQIQLAYPEAHNNLGNALKRQGQMADAIAAYRQAIHIKPEYAEAHYNIGLALQRIGQLDDAIAAYEQAIRLKPYFFESHNDLGIALKSNGQLQEAIAAYRKAIRIKPIYAQAHNNLGLALKEAGQLDAATAACRQALQLRPDFAEAYNNLGLALTELGQLDEAIAALREAIRLKPDYVQAHSNLLLILNYHPALDAQVISTGHRSWAEHHVCPLMNGATQHTNECSSDRRLRIGYISSDFKRHSVGYFVMPLLTHHDRRMLEIFCYANVQRPDEFTDRMRRSCDVWRSIVGFSDDDIAQMIRSDGIDILVDLAGHTAGNRLRVLARKPAPIQITYLGYPNTTGMASIDYRLTDSLADPLGITDHLYAEKLWRLPQCAWCYDPPAEAPQIQPRQNRPITFGCFNAFAKINRETIAIWSDLLKHNKESTLVLKSAGAGESSSHQRLTGEFIKHGISIDRIELRGRVKDIRGHLEVYGLIDVALDTFPYHGTTTTCEALWMGVPVITLAGQTHASRVGVSLLSHAGLIELVAQTHDEYLSIASELANDRSGLAALRAGLRDKLKSSSLMDQTLFAAGVDAAYRQMWRTWCESTPRQA